MAGFLVLMFAVASVAALASRPWRSFHAAMVCASAWVLGFSVAVESFGVLEGTTLVCTALLAASVALVGVLAPRPRWSPRIAWVAFVAGLIGLTGLST